MSPFKSEELVFQPRARLMLLLGDQLIRDPGLAVFELVKNAYDADASECIVTMRKIADPDHASIAITDNGSGMTFEIVRDVWLEPGTDYRAKQRSSDTRSEKYGRLPLGEKGVGRFAAHKLGRRITVITRAKGKHEVVVSIDWQAFEGTEYLSKVPVSIITRQPEVFTGTKTGTRIEVKQLREDWTRGKVRDLHRAITSICSPFAEPGDLAASLILEPKSDWLEGLLDVATVLDYSLFHATGHFSGSELTYSYEFTPLAAMKHEIKGRTRDDVVVPLMRIGAKDARLDLSRWAIGQVTFDLHVFDREPAVLALIASDRAGLKRFLDQNGGVRVYRDGVRVFDFAEPGNDWLDLGGRRVNIPTVRISNNQIIGAVSLEAASSTGLIEKTNREGFIENDAYSVFREAVLYTVTQIEAERLQDKKRLRQQYSRKKQKEPVVEELAELREEFKKRHLLKDLGGYLDRIETEFVRVRDTLLTAAGPGLTLTVVVHEVEKIIKELVHAVKVGTAGERISGLVHHLAEMVDGLAFLARKSGHSKERASDLIRQAVFNTEFRLKAHGVKLVNAMDHGAPDFSVKCVRRLVVATLMNLIDNSIYWLENKGGTNKQVYVGTMLGDSGKGALVVADNGPGFIDPSEYLIEPFYSRRPDGMGLGLHIAHEVAVLHKGQLLFPESGDVSLPKQFTGAVVALQFPEVK